MMTIKNHKYDIGFATPIEWLNEMLNKYGSLKKYNWTKDDDFKDLNEALEFSLYLGDDFLNFCDKENKMTTPEKRAKEQNELEKWLRENQPENKDYNTVIQEIFKNENRNTTNNIQNQKRSLGEL